MSGFIYILSNLSYKGQIKIGQTKNNPKYRVADLDNTSVPTPFKLEYFAFVSDQKKIEKKLHKIFDENRTRDNREFFKVSIQEVRQKISELSVKDKSFTEFSDEKSEAIALEHLPKEIKQIPQAQSARHPDRASNTQAARHKARPPRSQDTRPQAKQKQTKDPIHDFTVVRLISGVKARLSWPSGAVYEGEFFDKKINGKGKKTWPSGDIYEGMFVGGHMSGKGKYIYANGHVYEGEYVGGRKSGKGKLSFANKDIYEGEFVGGHRSGKGKYIWPNGDIYEGNFSNGKKSGIGKLTKRNGDIYEGRFVKNKKRGKGKLTYSNGDVYEGDFFEDRMDGYGKKTCADGRVYQGNWINGVPHGTLSISGVQKTKTSKTSHTNSFQHHDHDQADTLLNSSKKSFFSLNSLWKRITRSNT